MRFQRLRSKIEELQDITSEWKESSPVSQLEMDMALDRVKQIYELLRFEDIDIVEASTEEESVKEDSVKEEIVVEEIVETLIEEESAPMAVEERATLSKRERYNRILSLYGDTDAGENEVDEEDEEEKEVSVEEDVVKDEAIEVPELKETKTPIIEEKPPIAPTTPTTNRPSMAQQLTLNDRFLLSHDLFDDDMEALNRALEQLDEQPSYDDAIIFIAEEYSWSGSSAGAQIMITLLKNRFSLN